MQPELASARSQHGSVAGGVGRVTTRGGDSALVGLGRPAAGVSPLGDLLRGTAMHTQERSDLGMGVVLAESEDDLSAQLASRCACDREAADQIADGAGLVFEVFDRGDPRDLGHQLLLHLISVGDPCRVGSSLPIL